MRGGDGETEEGEEERRRRREFRFHPMRLLLTGSSCLEKSPRCSFGPQSGRTTSMGKRSFGCRGDREGVGERQKKVERGEIERGGGGGGTQIAFRDLHGASGDSKA